MHHTTQLIADRVRGCPPRRQQRGALHPWLWRRVLPAVAVLALLGLAVWAVRQIGHDSPGPKRQVARIAVLPDTPPPPPPPPPKERKEEPPKPEARPQPTPDPSPKPPAPADAPLKMEGAAGNGPSAFAAGSVSQDYKGGAVGSGGAASAATSAADRAAERLYAGSLRQQLRDAIEQHLPAEAGELQAGISVWLQPDGRIQRWELDAPQRPQDLQLAMDRSAAQLRLPPPPGLTQPLRFRLTVRAGG